jgi:hypothetical protein
MTPAIAQTAQAVLEFAGTQSTGQSMADVFLRLHCPRPARMGW